MVAHSALLNTSVECLSIAGFPEPHPDKRKLHTFVFIRLTNLEPKKMEWSNVLRWIALPIVMIIASRFTDSTVKWFMGIFISNHGLWEPISQSVSNVATGFIDVIIAYYMAPGAKMTVALVTTILLVVLYTVLISTMLIFVGYSEDAGIPLWVELLLVLTNLPGPILGYLTVKRLECLDC